MAEHITNFLSGVAQIMAIQPDSRPYRASRPYHGRTDMDALSGDWHRVGDDLESAIMDSEDSETSMNVHDNIWDIEEAETAAETVA